MVMKLKIRLQPTVKVPFSLQKFVYGLRILFFGEVGPSYKIKLRRKFVPFSGKIYFVCIRKSVCIREVIWVLHANLFSTYATLCS